MLDCHCYLGASSDSDEHNCEDGREELKHENQFHGPNSVSHWQHATTYLFRASQFCAWSELREFERVYPLGGRGPSPPKLPVVPV
jgi:hypothetical protein